MNLQRRDTTNSTTPLDPATYDPRSTNNGTPVVNVESPSDLSQRVQPMGGEQGTIVDPQRSPTPSPEPTPTNPRPHPMIPLIMGGGKLFVVVRRSKNAESMVIITLANEGVRFTKKVDKVVIPPVGDNGVPTGSGGETTLPYNEIESSVILAFQLAGVGIDKPVDNKQKATNDRLIADIANSVRDASIRGLTYDGVILQISIPNSSKYGGYEYDKSNVKTGVFARLNPVVPTLRQYNSDEFLAELPEEEQEEWVAINVDLGKPIDLQHQAHYTRKTTIINTSKILFVFLVVYDGYAEAISVVFEMTSKSYYILGNPAAHQCYTHPDHDDGEDVYDYKIISVNKNGYVQTFGDRLYYNIDGNITYLCSINNLYTYTVNLAFDGAIADIWIQLAKIDADTPDPTNPYRIPKYENSKYPAEAPFTNSYNGIGLTATNVADLSPIFLQPVDTTQAYSYSIPGNGLFNAYGFEPFYQDDTGAYNVLEIVAVAVI